MLFHKSIKLILFEKIFLFQNTSKNNKICSTGLKLLGLANDIFQYYNQFAKFYLVGKRAVC